MGVDGTAAGAAASWHLPLLTPGVPPCCPANPTPIRRVAAGGWERHLLHDFGAPVWRLSWSVSGNLLSVSDANNAVTLWKEAADGQWQQVTQ